jgi:hypothetical protein
VLVIRGGLNFEKAVKAAPSRPHLISTGWADLLPPQWISWESFPGNKPQLSIEPMVAHKLQ